MTQPTRTTDHIALEIHICDQRRSFKATFATEDQALAYLMARRSTHAVFELEDEPFDYDTFPRLYDLLYPTCEHGMDQSNCYGPQHYYMDDEERARYGF